MLSQQIRDLVARAGARSQRLRNEREREICAATLAEVSERSRQEAGTIFAWLDTDEGLELRRLMAFHKLDELPVHDAHICLVPEACTLIADNFGRYMSGVRRRVTTPDELVRIAGGDAVTRLAADVRERRMALVVEMALA